MSAAFRPFGIGDLIVLRSQLERYEPGEIAHIENIMAKEERGRFHRTLQQLETSLIQETEREEERRRDLESTERFELESEIKREVQNQEKISAGLEVAGGFGPVQVSAYAKYDRSSSVNDSARTAQKYAKEITEKAMERVRERVREERKRVERLETEEKNLHRFKNTEAQNISGIYRWVDKYYRVKPINYGRRLFYEVVVPEPAQFLLHARTWTLENKELPVSPQPPEVPTLRWSLASISISMWYDFSANTFRSGEPGPLKPDQLYEGNYAALVAEYGAEGVKPPPAKEIRISHKIVKEFDPSVDWVLDEEIELPDGYQATACQLKLVIKNWANQNGASDGSLAIWPYPAGYPGYGRIQIGTQSATQWRYGQFLGLPWGDEEVLTFALQSERRFLAISGAGNGVGVVAMNLLLTCERTAEAMAEWQLATFQAIMAAYNKQLLEYNEKLAAARVSNGVKITGDNPERNLVVIKAELKRQFLKLWMGTDFDLLPAVQDGSGSTLPVMLAANALTNSPKIAFMEESFSWDNLSFQLLPYFHGRTNKWVELSTYTDPDPIFENFLKAGAALVRVPVRPQYTHAVLYYQLTGQIWSRFAGEVPALSETGADPALIELYNSFLADTDPEEEDTDIHRSIEIDPDDPDSFLLKVPTSLIWLQPTSDLNGETE